MILTVSQDSNWFCTGTIKRHKQHTKEFTLTDKALQATQKKGTDRGKGCTITCNPQVLPGEGSAVDDKYVQSQPLHAELQAL